MAYIVLIPLIGLLVTAVMAAEVWKRVLAVMVAVFLGLYLSAAVNNEYVKMDRLHVQQTFYEPIVSSIEELRVDVVSGDTNEAIAKLNFLVENWSMFHMVWDGTSPMTNLQNSVERLSELLAVGDGSATPEP